MTILHASTPDHQALPAGCKEDSRMTSLTFGYLCPSNNTANRDCDPGSWRAMCRSKWLSGGRLIERKQNVGLPAEQWETPWQKCWIAWHLAPMKWPCKCTVSKTLTEMNWKVHTSEILFQALCRFSQASLCPWLSPCKFKVIQGSAMRAEFPGKVFRHCIDRFLPLGKYQYTELKRACQGWYSLFPLCCSGL